MSSLAKVLFIGDPHFKVTNVECISLFTSRVLSVVQSGALDFVVVAGDLLDNHDRVDVEPLNLALHFIHSIKQHTHTFVLVGNHDYKNNQQFLSDHHWMNALKQWSNVTIVDDIVKHRVGSETFLFVPYVPPGRFVEAIETRVSAADIAGFRAIFAHQEFYNCKMGPIKSKCGDKWDLNWPIVISGHIHDKQWSQANVYYPGSAMQHAFGQSSENTVSILHWTNDDELTYEEINLNMPKLTIKYLTMNDVMKPLSFKQQEFRRYKIVLQGTQEEFKTFKKNARYKQLLDEGIKISFKFKNSLDMGTVVPNLIEPKKKFIEILQEKVKNEQDPELERIFQKFLG